MERNLVIIENSTIDALVGNTTAREAFECLSVFQGLKRKRSCGRCRNGRAHEQQRLYGQVKECLAAARAEKLVLLKQLLRAKRLRVKVIRGTKLVSITF